MPRKARVIVPGVAHHITQRGNFKQTVFHTPRDHRKYAYLIQNLSGEYQVNVHAYCLMPNHVHFIVTPSCKEGLSMLFKNVHMMYSQYKNYKLKRTGHLWQSRFYSCVMDDLHLARAIRYVEMNPVRAGLTMHPWEFPWSSTRQHMRLEKNPIIGTNTTIFRDVLSEWDRYLLSPDQEMLHEIRNKTHQGLAIGSEDFIDDMERRTGMKLRASKRGRPKK